jgi:hypothetical protein
MENEPGTWWILRGSERQGPYTREALRQMAASGELDAADKLWAQGLVAPVSAAQLHDVLPAAGSSTAAEALPLPAGFTVARSVAQPLSAGTSVEMPGDSVLGVTIVMVVMLLFLFLFLMMIMSAVSAITQSKGDLSLLDTVRMLMPAFGGVILLTALSFAYAIPAGRRRRAARRACAVAAGFEFTARPSQNYGGDIVRRAIISASDSKCLCSNLLRGMHHGYFFQIVDYHHRGSANGGPTQSVVAIRLRKPNVTPFAIVPDSGERYVRMAGREALAVQPAGLGKQQLVVTEPHGQAPHLGPGFLYSCAKRSDAFVEVTHDRLLVYRIGQKLAGEACLDWVDFAISLEKLLDQPA